jgi:uncharacterized protein (TIGR02453 family)
MTTLHPALFKFLDAIKEENSRKYFASIRTLYDDIWNNLNEFINLVIKELSKEDTSLTDIQAKQCLFRIYRDARRLKEWDLIYKHNRWAHITDTGKNSTKAWYYIHLQSGWSFLWGWIYRPTSEQLLKIRNFLTHHGGEYYDIISNKKFKSRFGSIQWESLTKLPRGFDKDTSYPELVMKKQHLILHHYTDEEILSEDFFDRLIEDCKIAKPFFDFINQSL